MALAAIAHSVAFAWWFIAVLLLVASTLASLMFPWPWRGRTGEAFTPPVSAVVPIKGLDSGFEAAQRSLFDQDYPALEILIASAEPASEAVLAIEAIQAQRPEVVSRLIVATPRPAASPKLGNLWAAIEQADADLVLIKDSNVRLEPGAVARLVGCLEPGVGVVCALTILTAPGSPAAWVEASILNGHYARVLMLARALGLGFGVGKITLFRRSDLERAGGLRALAWALGEDEAMTSVLARLGLRTVLAAGLHRQEAGARSWPQVWNRFLRWKVIWRVQAPAVFVASLVSSASLAAVAGACAAPLLGVQPGIVALATLVVWWGLETLVCVAKGWPVSLGSPLVFVVREVMDLLVWVRAMTTSEVDWAGVRYRSETASQAALAAARGRP